MKKFILPIAAAVVVIAAVVVLIAVPRKGSSDAEKAGTNGSQVIINTEDLSESQISLLRIDDNSKVELVAVKGADGSPKVALGTCQSCNGSPGAYYSQTDDLLKCNNCGLTFPLSVIGESGSGCHPIMLDESKVTRTDSGVEIDKAYLLDMEYLFANVAQH